MMADANAFLIYQDDNGVSNVNVRFEGEDVWLAAEQLQQLFQASRQDVAYHIQQIYGDGELMKEATCKNFLQVRHEGKRSVKRNFPHYNLDMILLIGMRIRSDVAVRFRQWAIRHLHEFAVKGFTLDDDRLKGNRSRYFCELLQRIRDIRMSERNFYQKVTDTFATSVDYDRTNDITCTFFATVQNKLHFAAHRHTAAEVFMGLNPHVPLFAAGSRLSSEQKKMLQRLCAADGSVKDLTAAGVDVFLRTCGRINEITPGSVRVSFAVRRWLEAKIRQETLARAVAEFAEEQGDDGRWPFLKKTLFPYQREGAMHLAGKGRAILADEMGLGKTVQGIAAALLKLFGSLFRFNRRFYAFDSEGKNEGMCNLDKLHEATASILLRRRKSAVEDELPGRMTKTYKTGMTPEQERRYSAHMKNVAELYEISKRRPLSPKEQERLQIELGLMRMLCDTCYITDPKIKDSPKLDEFENVLDDILAADEAAGEDGRHPVQRRGSPECRCAHRTGRGTGRCRETACESRKGVRRRAASAGYGRPVDERRLCA